MSLEKEVAELIASEVGWFNGWKASEEMFNKSCRKAARKVIKRLTKRASDFACTCAENDLVDLVMFCSHCGGKVPQSR